MSQSQSHGRSVEAKPFKMATSLPVSLLRLLEPGIDGEWKVTEQTQQSFVLSFFMKQGNEALHYNMSPCLTKADVEKQCEEFIYEWKNSRSNNRNTAALDCTPLTPAATEEISFASCAPLAMPVSQPHGQFTLSSGIWTERSDSFQNPQLTGHPTQGYPRSQMVMSAPLGSLQSPSTSNPAFMNFSAQGSVSTNTDWQTSGSRLGMGYDSTPMSIANPSLESNVMTPSSVDAAWDPMAELDHDTIKPDVDGEPSIDWELMWNDN